MSEEDWPPETGLSEKRHQQLLDILLQHESCFTDCDSQIPNVKNAEYTIELTHTAPVDCSPIKCPFELREP